jgi:hypothetical protein
VARRAYSVADYDEEDDVTLEKIAVSHDTAASIIEKPDVSSLKRLAWAYGCAKKESDEERILRDILIDRVMRERAS